MLSGMHVTRDYLPLWLRYGQHKFYLGQIRPMVFTVSILHELLDKGLMIARRGGAVKTDAINVECMHDNGLPPKGLFNTLPGLLLAQIAEGDTYPIISEILPPDRLAY